MKHPSSQDSNHVVSFIEQYIPNLLTQDNYGETTLNYYIFPSLKNHPGVRAIGLNAMVLLLRKDKQNQCSEPTSFVLSAEQVLFK